MRINKMLGAGLVALLLASMFVVTGSSPWDGVPDDPTPAQAIWVDPKNTTGVSVSDTFVVDVLVNITDPDPLNSPPDTLYGIEYKLKWNNTMLDVVGIDTHGDTVADAPAGWNSPFVAVNTTIDLGNGFDEHYYSTITLTGPGMVGVYSFCTYTFRAIGKGNHTLDIYGDKFIDDSATKFPHTTVDGHVTVSTTPQAIWVDPKFTTGVKVGDTFVVDVLVNITDPDPLNSPPDGLMYFAYKLKWDSTRLEVVEIQTHTDDVPSGDRLPGWIEVLVDKNETGSNYHYYSVLATLFTAFTGVASICTYTFRAMSYGECTLDIYDDTLRDDRAVLIPHTTVDGHVLIGVSPTPAQAIWVNPKNTTGVSVSDTFVVDVLVNITDPDPLNSPPDTLLGIEYKLKWNNTMLDVVGIDTHGDTVADAPAGWNSPYVAANTTIDLGNGFDEHSYGTITLTGPGMVGVYSFCTYTFRAMGKGNHTLDLYDDKLVDDDAIAFAHTTVDGCVIVGRAPVVQHFPVTWKWLDRSDPPGFPVWLTANVTLSIIHSVTNFSFNRSLGQISFDITSVTQRTCNVTVPKLLMDGAFKVLIDDVQTPSILAWNESHTFVSFTYSQGIHNIKIIGEFVTRLRGIDFLSIVDVNGDGIVDIVDIVTVALRFGWEEDL